MRLALILGLGGVLLAQAGLAEELPGDPEAGRKKAGQCRTCHGLNGFAQIPIAPHIGGENPLYIVHQLTAFRDGTREHEMMSVVAKALDDQSIADLAAWFSSQSVTATLPAGATEDMAPEACVGCHGADGIALIEDAPNLAGENVVYIETQLKAFRTGKRVNDTMTGIAAELSDADMNAAADWYAAIKLDIPPVK
ncbi:cytochrome c [Ostreiculturibacter nitratireducens]|uniref:c-type cytochrome n=1 Tax=Ostreiculturibacter nitratireducens TaxID=3075226 RepID=UPI0031B64F50